MSLPHLPVLRQGKPYESLEKVELTSVRTGEPIALVSQANAGMIRRDMRRSTRDVLRAIPAAKLVAMAKEAGKLFMESELPLSEGQTQSVQDYVEQLSATSGLPYNLVRRNMAKVNQVFTEMDGVIRGLSRGLDLSVIDSGTGEQNGVPVSFYPVANALGVVLPSNSPGVNTLWMPALALKTPVLLKPGREEPWTPFRIIQAFIGAGFPAEAFSFYPTDHEGSAAVMEVCQRALIFGDVGTVEKYAGNPGVSVHGPGWSKVLIGDDVADKWPEYVDLIVDSIAANGGRSCINASAVLIPRHAEELAEAVAQKLAQIKPVSYSAEGATLSGFANPKMAEFIDASIEEGLGTAGATEVTAKYRDGERKVQLEGSNYLQPTLVLCPNMDHPLANREFLFPYASVVEVPQDKMLDVMGDSLVVTGITNDPEWTDALISSPHIDRLNIGPMPTTQVQWDQPHEGNLFEFLYRRRAIQRL
jgi:acyl-CoA reductase-like NAD-dependent aldehyde dehydrogenase